MAHLVLRRPVARTDLAILMAPRDDIVAERQVDGDADLVTHRGPIRFTLAHGPFLTYERTLEILEVAPHTDPVEIEERFTYTLAVPRWWGLLFRWPVRRALSRRPEPRPPGARPAQPWWAPPDRLDARATWALSMVCTIAVVAGYLGTVIGQTLTFAADEFGSSDRAQGFVLAAVRVGTLASVAATVLADRRGRRPLIMACALVATGATAAGALTPDLVSLGLTQTVARGLTTGLGLLIAVVAAEELPSGSRAYGASVIAMAAGLGSGMVLWLLPLADLGESGWRVIYVAPLLSLPLVVWSARRLPETIRFETAERRHASSRKGTTLDRIDRRRLALLGAANLLALFFLAPASQFQNEFLRDERGFSGADITAFVLITTTPASLAVFFGGRLADRRGRRPVAAIGMVGAAAFTVVGYLSHGWLVWVSAALRASIGGLLVPALGVYGPELFGTRSRARANGVISLVGVVGSAAGLLAVGAMSDVFGGLGEAFLVAAVAPMAVAVLVLTSFPETTHRELEELNPQDDDSTDDRAEPAG